MLFSQVSGKGGGGINAGSAAAVDGIRMSGHAVPGPHTTSESQRRSRIVDFQAMAQRVAEAPHGGRVHVFLGHPQSDGCDKTTVEPGNVYSPGVWTCGVSLWFEVKGQWMSPLQLPEEEIAWGFGGEGDAEGHPPVLRARYRLGALTVDHEMAYLGSEGAAGMEWNRVRIEAAQPLAVRVCIGVRDVGPAGGGLRKVEWSLEKQALRMNGGAELRVEAPAMAGATAEPTANGARELVGLAWADLSVASGAAAEVRFVTLHGFADRTGVQPEMLPPSAHVGRCVAEAFELARREWAEALPARVFCPDKRVETVWQQSAWHILAAMEGGLARIGQVNYPLFWMRDGILIVRALDLIGRGDLARRCNDYLAPLDFTGGFGAESDSPGEGIWSLVAHARLSGDDAWLAEKMPHLRRRVKLLDAMLRATKPLRAMTENRMPGYWASPSLTVFCMPAVNGLVHGRMDHHTPDFFINCWVVAGYTEAAWAARRLGHAAEAVAWEAAAQSVERALAQHLLPAYGGNPRDPIVTPHPTGVLTGDATRQELTERFRAWFHGNRLDEKGVRQREPEWTYFEAAQAHNALLLGLKEEAWTCLDGLLNDATQPWNVTAWIEGPAGGAEFLPFANGPNARGWLRPDRAVGGNMPHNWTGAEVLALLRDVFVRETNEGLVLGDGVPAGWLRPGATFGVERLPTSQGPVTYTARVAADGTVGLEYLGPTPYRVAWS